MSLSEKSSSPAPGGFKTLQEEIAYYKAQYEHLETELQEFQASSRELEAELEKDVEASEKRERTLKEKVEALQYEVDEWKTKYKQSKAEASTTQNNLQKEITSLRDTNRTLQLKLRDIEVANDDFERQARNTTSSLEDMESKYNVALERGVMMEEEIKTGEQEREALRIDSQRLRDELSDLKIEAEITQEKLRAAEKVATRRIKRVSHNGESVAKSHGPKSPSSEISGLSASTHEIHTPPAAKSETSGPASDAPTPPSPPLSETSGLEKNGDAAVSRPKRTAGVLDSNVTPRPRHTRGPSLVGTSRATATPSFGRQPPGGPPKPSGLATEGIPRSGSLYQIRGLIGKVQKLEQRVHSARSKLPAPTTTPPRASPRSANADAVVPPTVTVRSSKKYSTNGLDVDSATSSIPIVTDDTDNKSFKRRSRISMGAQSADGSGIARPDSRASNASHSSQQFARPGSRASLLGRPPPSTTSTDQRLGAASDTRRPRSSLSGRATPSQFARPSMSGFAEDEGETSFATPTARRTTLDRNGAGSAIPTPTALRRQSSLMTPVARRPTQQQDVGETY